MDARDDHRRVERRGAEPSRSAYPRLKPGPGHEAAEVEGDQRRRLVRALIELAAERGYEAVTVRGVTKLAGVSTHTFYERFHGKEDCLLAASASVCEGLRREVLGSRDPGLTIPRQLHRTLAAICGLPAADLAGARLALLEVYSGGPAALPAVTACEAQIASALKECLERRGARLPRTVVAWILAGALHLTRAAALDREADVAEGSILALARWAAGLLEGPRRSPAPARVPLEPPPSPQPTGERAAILAAVLALAGAQGFWSLSETAICARAGVSRRAFGREFADLGDAYLEAIRGLAGEYLATPDPLLICRRAAADPAAARLVFLDILIPGRAGLLARERLIAATAARWRRASGLPEKPPPLAVEAGVAALWSALAFELDQGQGHGLPRRVRTYRRLLAASLRASPHASPDARGSS